MFRTFKDIDSIKDALEASIEQKVTIILERGQRLRVEVDAVVGNLLVASIGNRIVFIDIECICAVVTCCEEILESLLGGERSRRRREEEESSRKHEEVFFEEVSRIREEEESRKHGRL